MREHPLPNWICDICSSRNDEDLVTCTYCDSPRPESESYAEFWIEELENDTGTGIISIR